MPRSPDFFTSRWGLILSVIGIAVGTGNIWRFSRIAAQNGGGSFLIPWVVFLLLWSVPLIMAELAIGKWTRRGPIGAIAMLAGERFGWMGAFVAFVTTAIMFYYSVVAGWCLYYLVLATGGTLRSTADHAALWEAFTTGPMPIVFHLIAMGAGSLVVYRGVRGIERANRALIPLLVLILASLAVRAVTLEGASAGIAYLFTPSLETLLDYRVWLHALTQNAWDTGAGWGLIMVYAIYARQREDITINACLTAFGNNSVSLLAGLIIFSTIFALDPGDGVTELISGRGSTNTGLAFIFLPQLFQQMPGGPVVQTFFSSIFFLGLSVAAITSLISMIELVVRIFTDLGLTRPRAILLVALVGFLFGLPSALSVAFLNNQDWVWGIALMISGGFISFAVIRHGVDRLRREVINGEGCDVEVGRWYNAAIGVLVPLQVFVLVGWWLWAATQWDPGGWWDPFRPESVGTCLFQWGIVMLGLVAANRWLVRRTLGRPVP